MMNSTTPELHDAGALAEINRILSKVDESGDGGIDRAEALPALARWDSLANIHVEQQKSCACAVS